VDMFVAGEIGKVQAPPKARRPARSAGRAPQAAPSTPVPVTRGSGPQKGPKKGSLKGSGRG
jgi:hypothetical protein